eukprot:gb/GECG01009324.1/.p1 GENE.gb/GECG01009324.1/~~gb/GECG01009324.1/.p1  ORF type:complete len:394 (+),score=24.75 gb/GECG01009324.1/:1-1182(+)
MLRRFVVDVPRHVGVRTLSTPSAPRTGIVMLNMGGPGSLDGPRDGVHAFLHRLFTDNEIIPLGPFQNYLGPLIARRRAPKVKEQYKEIGGKSPIGYWTDLQGQEMCKKLDRMSPDTAPHKHYVAFRYAPPLSEDALMQMKEDGVERAIAFSQYPQYSCTTTGSSLNHLWREVERLGLENQFKWSVIDRWPTQPQFIQAVGKRIMMALQKIPDEELEHTIILFTAHSLPVKVLEKGDHYAAEVAGTVQRVMDHLRETEFQSRAGPRHLLSWQSKVGPLPWLSPSTGDMVKKLGNYGHKNVVAVPIAFTSDHIETLYEIAIEYAEDAHKAGIEQFLQAPALNDEELFTDAQANLVKTHLERGDLASTQYALRCPTCTNDRCRTIVNPFKSGYQRL